MLQKSHPYKMTTLSSIHFLTYQNNLMFFLMRQPLGGRTLAKYLRNAEAKRFNSDDLASTYFVRTGHVARI